MDYYSTFDADGYCVIISAVYKKSPPGIVVAVEIFETSPRTLFKDLLKMFDNPIIFFSLLHQHRKNALSTPTFFAVVLSSSTMLS
jgi:hypothetical protein